ncbi:MAG: VLRF1 family aeRF1-type release factor, partial [Syntrophothermus sp.]
MAQPSLEDVRELAAWRPPLGVISVYLDLDPADREGAWRTRLRNGLEDVLSQVREADHDRRMATQATVERIAARLENQLGRPRPRGEAGFVEVAAEDGEGRWWPSGVPPRALAPVALAPRPLVGPLVDLRQSCAPHGVALVSAERVRVLSFAERELAELADWELSVTSLDWRERKASRSSNPARAQGVSSSGHDRYRERLEHNRERFLAEVARLAAERLRRHG